MSIQMHLDIQKVSKVPSIAYFTKEYLSTQSYDNPIVIENDEFFLPLNGDSKHAISIPRSPFGSFYSHSSNHQLFNEFNEQMIKQLSMLNYTELTIIHPPSIYAPFVSATELMESGYSKLYSDINQHILLTDDWSDNIHAMQKRKLQSLHDEGFEFKVMEPSDFKVAHQFLTVCRQAQGLQINISWEHLEKLVTLLPYSYDCFGVFREGKISALCIAVRVSEEIAYYYLPATSPMFRSHSPMVLLISGMVEFYRNLQFKYLDLGVSSANGKVQETLRIFKERMGAEEAEKPTFKRSI